MKKFLTVLVMLIFTAGVWAENYTFKKLPKVKTVVVY